MPLTDDQIAVLAPFADTIIAAAGTVNIAPATYASAYGAGGCTLVNARGLQAKAAKLRSDAQTASAAAESQAQALEAEAQALQESLTTEVGS